MSRRTRSKSMANCSASAPMGKGGTDYTWMSGPNGYGFGLGPMPDQSLEVHRENIRTFLAQIDPSTGYIEDDCPGA